MGYISDLLFGRSHALSEVVQETFAVDAGSVPPEVFGLTSYSTPVTSVPRIDRKNAMSVPAVKRCRDLICGTLGGLPIDVVGPDKSNAAWALMEQPEKSVPRSVTMTRTFEDMLFTGNAWWLITKFGWHGYPTKVKRISPNRVSVDEDRDIVYIDGKQVDQDSLIRFDSPTDALLVAGARAIRTCLSLDAAAQRYADEPLPLAYFRPNDNLTVLDDQDVTEFLDSWSAARSQRATGYVPHDLKLETAGWTPEQIQLADARQHAVLEIARLAGVDAEELGVSTTSRTYQNQQDRRKNFLDFTLGQYRQAIEDRLSMNDTTPRGYQVRFNLSSFLRSDDKTRMETYEVALRAGAITKDEIRELEDRPSLTATERTESAPAVEEITE